MIVFEQIHEHLYPSKGARDDHDVLCCMHPQSRSFLDGLANCPCVATANTKSKEYICVYSEPWFRDVVLGDWGEGETDL